MADTWHKASLELSGGSQGSGEAQKGSKRGPGRAVCAHVASRERVLGTLLVRVHMNYQIRRGRPGREPQGSLSPPPASSWTIQYHHHTTAPQSLF